MRSEASERPSNEPCRNKKEKRKERADVVAFKLPPLPRQPRFAVERSNDVIDNGGAIEPAPNPSNQSASCDQTGKQDQVIEYETGNKLAGEFGLASEEIIAAISQALDEVILLVLVAIASCFLGLPSTNLRFAVFLFRFRLSQKTALVVEGTVDVVVIAFTVAGKGM